jgi:hypothetical protein
MIASIIAIFPVLTGKYTLNDVFTGVLLDQGEADVLTHLYRTQIDRGPDWKNHRHAWPSQCVDRSMGDSNSPGFPIHFVYPATRKYGLEFSLFR